MQDASAGNVADLVRRAAARGPDRVALIGDDRTLTWGELDAQVDAAAQGLASLGRDPGARVAVALPNVPELAVVYFGALRAGLVAVPVNPGYTTRELRHVLSDSGASILIGTPEIVDAVAALRPELPDLRHVFGQRELPSDGVARSTGAATGVAVLLYTSGTSGAPKGAMLSHRALIANQEQLARLEPPPVGPDDVVLLALPLFHAYGLNGGLGAVAYHGATGVLIERFDPTDTLRQVARHGVTVIVGVPPMFVAWSLLPDSADALAGVRLIVSGGAPLEPAAAARFTAVAGKPIFEGYGLTETAPVLTSTVASPVPKSGSIGRPIPGVELRLEAADGSTVWPAAVEDDDEDDDGGDPGEIVVRGANLFSGYWPDGGDGPDAEGWWHTGDIAYADEDGDLFLVDRLGELILVSGFNVYPHEVEQVLLGHPAVAGAAAVGIPHPYTGETVKAYVVREPGVDVTAGELLDLCERNLARFKCPTAIEFVSELPYSIIGKVRKKDLQ